MNMVIWLLISIYLINIQRKIYKLESPSGLIYIGSTCEKYLCRRLSEHKEAYKRYKKGKTKLCPWA